jgi:TP901 family phage tail tape measure protein/lambda family phage tail tape measure protein
MNNRELVFIIRARNQAARQIQQFRNQLRGIGQSARQAQAGMDATAGAAARMATALRAAATAPLGRLTAQIASLRASMLSTLVSTLKLTAAFGGIFAAGAGISGTVSTIAAFGDEMQRVAAISGATTEQMEALEERARELGSTTRFTATQAAEGLTFLSRAGFTAEQSIEAIGPALQLAQAGALDLSRSADILSNIMTAFSISADRASGAADVLALTANSSNTSIEQLGDAVKFVGPVASSLGVSLNEVTSAIGALGNAGLQGTLAGTGLRIAFQRLLAPTKQAEEAIQSIGLTLEDLDPARAGNNLLTILERLREAQERVGAPEFARAAADIFSARGSTTVAALVAQIGAFRELRTSSLDAQGAVRDTAEVMDQSLTGAVKTAASAFQELALTIGDLGLEAILIGLARGVTDLANALSGLLGAFDVFKAGEDAGLALGDVIQFLTTVAVPALIGIIGGPLGIAIGATIGLAIAAWNRWEGEMVKVGDTWTSVGGIIINVAQRIVAAIELLIRPIGVLLSALFEATTGDFTAALAVIERGGEDARRSWDVLFEGIEEGVGRTSTLLDSFAESGIFEDGAIGSGLTDFTMEVNRGTEAVKKIGDEVDDLQSKVDGLVSAFAPGLATIRKFAEQQADLNTLNAQSDAQLKELGVTRATLTAVQVGLNQARENEINFLREGNRQLAEEARLVGLSGVARELEAERIGAAREALRRDPTGQTGVNEEDLIRRLSLVRQAAQNEFLVKQADVIDSLRQEQALLGQTPDQIERIKLATDRLQAAKEAGFSDAEARQFAAAAVQAFDDVQRRQEEFERDAARGAERAFQKYIDEAQDFATEFERITGDAIKGLEDTIVDFVQTGKLSFQELLQDIAGQLIRSQVRGLLGNLLDLSGAGGTLSPAQQPNAAATVQQAQQLFDQQTVNTVRAQITQAGTTTAGGITVAGQDVAASLREVAATIRATPVGGAGGLQELAIPEAPVDFWETTQSAVASTTPQLRSTLQTAASDLDDMFGESTSEISSTLFEASGTLSSSFGSLGSILNSLFSPDSSLFQGGGFVGGLTSGAGGGFFSDIGASLFSLFKDGGIMTSAGPAPLRRYADGGIATNPQLALFGEGDRPEAYVPLPDGRRIPVTMEGGMSSNQRPVAINMTVNAVDAASFGRNSDQIARRTSLALQRAANRDN